MDLEKEVIALRAEIKRLSSENANLTKLINNHAVLINKNTTQITQVDRNLRNEVNRIAAAFRKIQNVLNRGKE